MLEKAFNDVYTKFKLHFYQNVFQRFATREATLTTVESFCMEGIMAMGEPTIAEFSRMMQISTPNAAYKIGSLVRKGYVEKIQSTTDRREYHLRPTQKYIDYYNISYSYLSTVVQRVNKRFPKEDVKKLEQMLTEQMVASEGVTESLKAMDMMSWVRKMNSIKSRVQEIVMSEVIFA
jgi:DNA-binding MarR family transcriptional regulator